MKTIILILAVLLLNINLASSKDGILILKSKELITKPIKKQKSNKKINKKVLPIQETEELIHLMDSITTQRYSNIPLKNYKSDSDGGVIINIEKIYRLHKNLKLKNKIKNYNQPNNNQPNKINYLHFVIQEDNIS